MIYVYNAKTLVSFTSISMNIVLPSASSEINNPNWHTIRPVSSICDDGSFLKVLEKDPSYLTRLFYYYNHEIYDPVFLWNMPNGIVIEGGTNRYIGKMIQAEKEGTTWLPAILISPEPYTTLFKDLHVGDLLKTIDNVEFPASLRNLRIKFWDNKLYDNVIKANLRNPEISKNIFDPSKGSLIFKKFAESKLNHHYNLLMNGEILSTIGDTKKSLKDNYEIKTYDRILSTLSDMLSNIKKDIL